MKPAASSFRCRQKKTKLFNDLRSMTTAKKYKSPVFAAIHEMISDLHEIDLVDDKTMQHFDKSCLAKPGEKGVDGWPEAGEAS